MRAWNTAIAEVAKQHGAVLVNLYGRWSELASHAEYISTDVFYPSSLGYQRIAELVLESLPQHVSSTAQQH